MVARACPAGLPGGVAFAVVSLGQAISHKHRFNRSTAVWTFVCAVLLLNLPALMDSLSMTVFNQSSEQSLSYSPPSSPGSVYIQFAVYAIATVGLIGIARGLCLMRDTPNQHEPQPGPRPSVRRNTRRQPRHLPARHRSHHRRGCANIYSQNYWLKETP